MAARVPPAGMHRDTRMKLKVENLDSTTDPAQYRARNFSLVNVLMCTDARLPGWLKHAQEVTEPCGLELGGDGANEQPQANTPETEGTETG